MKWSLENGYHFRVSRSNATIVQNNFMADVENKCTYISTQLMQANIIVFIPFSD